MAKKRVLEEYIETENFHLIKEIVKGSIAHKLRIKPGDSLAQINGEYIKDVLDYRFLARNEEVTLLIYTKRKKLIEIDILKDEDDDLGLVFEDGLMDCYSNCRNKCIFCFIDQMPKGMRETLYFKDDDSRLSFLQGNYITLTNLSKKDVERMIYYKLSPINISIHTMNPVLRCEMLNNRFAGESLKILDDFKQADLKMNGQIVLCKGINDGAELEYSLEKLQDYAECFNSISIVPVGVTKFREGLKELETFNKEDSIKVINQIHGWQQMYMHQFNKRLVYASDEWYIVAGMEIPSEDDYDAYPQIENGVGMVRNLIEEVRVSLSINEGDDIKRKAVIATGTLIAPILKDLCQEIKEKYPNTDVEVIPIINNFFGEKITVAGLVTGTDLIDQLKGKIVGIPLLLTERMFRTGEEVLLDDLTKADVEKALQTKIHIVKSDGTSFVDSILECVIDE